MVSNEYDYREASHYNSWYMGPKEKLEAELNNYLEKPTTIDQNKYKLKGMIVPHAGIMWSGQCAAYGFKHIANLKNVKRIFIIGPSHFVEFPGCGITLAKYWKTPFCDLKIDLDIIDELSKQKSKGKNLFNYLPMELDEYEHSLEIQTPYLGYLLNKYHNNQIPIVPILTGKLTYDEELIFSEILEKYYDDEENFFVISEDFCHWGKRHKFFFLDDKFEKIYESIEFLDNMAFDIIQSKKSKEFSDYLSNWKNNLCGGGSPITIYLALIEKFIAKKKHKENEIKLMHYTKSDPFLNDKNKESVSYAVILDYYEI